MSRGASSSSRTPSSSHRRSCSNCRRRKVRCDAQRPVCTQCISRASDGDGPCDYGDNTTDEMLVANISRLEQRIRELEASENPLAMTLQNPYSAPDPANPNQEPPVDIRRARLDSFFSYYGTVFGVFLNASRLLESACSPLPLGHPSRPSPGLMQTLYFLVSYLHSGPEQRDSSLPQVLQQVSNMLSSAHPKKLIHAIQAEILLANYFFHARRMLEGKYHLDTAISLVAGARLHSLRSASVASAATPVDPVEEGELINAFWMVYSMHNLWDSLGPSVVVFDRDDQGIDTPWPMDMSEYEQNGIPGTLTGHSTVRNFLSGAPSSSGYGNSLIAKYAKASVLFSRANYLATTSSGDMNSSVRQQLIASSRNLDTLIDSFTSELPSVEPTSPSEVHTTTFVHLLAYASTIQVRSVDNANSRNKSLAVARAAIELLPALNALSQHSDVARAPILNPMFGGLLGIVGRVLMKELERLRQSGSRSRSAAVGNQLRELEGMLGALVTTMQEFSGYSPFVAYQLEKLTQSAGH